MSVGRWPWYLLFLISILLLGCRQPWSPSNYSLLVIDTWSDPFSGNDTYLTLYDSAGNILAEDDNSNPDQVPTVRNVDCSRIWYEAGLPGGTYYIKVENRTATGNPNYGIRVVDYNPGTSFAAITPANEDQATPPYEPDDAVDGNGLPTAPADIDLDQVISRSIDPWGLGGDVDWYRLVLP